MYKVTFNNKNNPFSKSLKEKVNNYFLENRISNTGNRSLYLKSVLLILTAAGAYSMLVFFSLPVLVSVLLCGLLGFNLAFIGFNVMHEGGHHSFSKYKWINEISAYTLNMMGGTIYFWKQKHNINHHTYTNIDGMDHDIDIKFMRMHEEQPKRTFHKFQHFYWVILYGISYLAWIFYQDFEKYFSRKMGPKAERTAMPLKEHAIFWITKLTYVTVYMIIPILMLGPFPVVLGLLITGLVCGFTLSIVFQLAHVVEGTQFPKPNEGTTKLEQEWAVHQINTTANFATNNKVVSWFLGGLNFQVEHHLFPRISHVHYPKISQLVRETCKEFNIAYLEHRSLGGAFISHLAHIRKMGAAK